VQYEIYLRKFQAGFQLGPDGSQKNEVSEVRVRLSITSGYARPPKVRDISSKYHPPLLVVAPTF